MGNENSITIEKRLPVIYKFQSLTKEIIKKTPKFSKQYFSLDPILKYNFDQSISALISISVISILKNLEIYSSLSSFEEIKLVDSKYFLNLAAEVRKNLELALEEKINNSMLIDEIQTILKCYQESQIDFSETEVKFRELNKKIKNDLRKTREKEEKFLINRNLKSKVINEIRKINAK